MHRLVVDRVRARCSCSSADACAGDDVFITAAVRAFAGVECIAWAHLMKSDRLGAHRTAP